MAEDQLKPDTITESVLYQGGTPGLNIGDNISVLKPGTIPGVTPGVNPYTEYSNQIGLLGQTNGWWNNMGQAAGLAGTGIGIWNDTIGPKAQLYKTQMAAMKQNMANVKEDRANHQTYVANIGGGFNSAFKPGSGLAASASRVG